MGPSNGDWQGKIESTKRGERQQLEGGWQESSVVGVGGQGGGGAFVVNGSTHTMPGLIQQTESTVKLSDSEKSVNRSEVAPASAGVATVTGMADLKNGDFHMNGERPLVNGHRSKDISTTSAVSHPQKPLVAQEKSRHLPPEIQHVSSGYVSLSALVGRLAQETFNDLGNVISDMADLPVEQPRPNGVLNHVNHLVNGNHAAKSDASVQKKLRMLNFTNNWRPKFIKILVLSQWARQAEAVSRVIDLKHWEDMQRMEYDGAATAIGELKRLIAAMKEPSPDITTALEVLLTGSASWLPDFGYLKVEPLSTPQMLSALRRINTLLSIRLNLHEKIPPMFRDFSVASGRATFRVPDEFEVDISLADEDPTSQLYFIDLRFTFLPSVSLLPPGLLRSEVEARANQILSQEGLQGLFDLLHNLVLTHKLSILRSQAYDMARGHWSEDLVVEPVRRSVVVQYWSGRPGGKNWIEIGIKRGKEKRVAYAETVQRVPHISMRCFRAGKEVHDIDVSMRLGDLSMEHILKQVIARHSSHIFNGIATKLLSGLLYSSGCLRVKHKASDAEPLDTSLLVQLTATTAIKIIQEPISGRFAIQPSSHLNGRAEYELNRLTSPIMEAHSQLSYLRSLVSVDEVETNAHDVGWENARSINPEKEVMQKHFPKATLQTRFFRRPQWCSTWILAFTTSLEGDFWWVVELTSSNPSPEETHESAFPERLLKAAYRIVLREQRSLVFASSHQTLTQVEWHAAGMISQHSDASKLADELRHIIPVSSTGAATFSMLVQVPKTPSPWERMGSSLHSSQQAFNISGARETVGIFYRGVDVTTRAATRVAIARANKPVSNLRKIVSKIRNLAVVRSPVSGAAISDPPIETDVLQFTLVHRVGESCIPDLIGRLNAIERLLDFVYTLERSSLKINSASLSHVTFTYGPGPKPLHATIDFPATAPMHLSFPRRNPHLRVQDYLTWWLSKRGLVPVIGLLRITLPILNAFATLEKVHKSNDICISARSEQWYEVRYSSPLPRGGFDITLRLRRGEPYWFIKESSIKKMEALADEEAWTLSLKSVTRGRGRGWRGVRGGVIAQTDDAGIGEALQKLDQVFRDAAKHVPEDSRPAKRKAESETVEID